MMKTKPNRFRFRAWDKRRKILYLPDTKERLETYDRTRMSDFWADRITTLHASRDEGFLHLSLSLHEHVGDDYEGREEKDFIIMQSTGLADKNGKEIYEGDIVEWEDTPGDFMRAEVVWGASGAWVLRGDGLEEDHHSIKKYSEVIGNIYENPELLE